MVVDRRPTIRLLCGAAALLATVAGTSGCTDGASTSGVESATSDSTAPVDDGLATTAVTIAATTTTTMTAAAAAGVEVPATALSPSPSPSPAASAIDAVALLQTAMDNAAPGYHYHSIVTVGGSTVVEVDGDRIGEGTRVGVVRDGVSVQYVITPGGTWVQPDGGDWDQMDTPPATVDPIAALRSPSAATVVSADGTAIHLSVSVPAASLGLTGDATVDLAVVVDTGNLAAVVYTTSIEGQPASVETVVGPVVDGTPVVAPI